MRKMPRECPLPHKMQFISRERAAAFFLRAISQPSSMRLFFTRSSIRTRTPPPAFALLRARLPASSSSPLRWPRFVSPCSSRPHRLGLQASPDLLSPPPGSLSFFSPRPRIFALRFSVCLFFAAVTAVSHQHPIDSIVERLLGARNRSMGRGAGIEGLRSEPKGR